MKRFYLSIAVTTFTFGCVSGSGDFVGEVEGEPVTSAELNAAQQAKLYDAELKLYNTRREIVAQTYLNKKLRAFAKGKRFSNPAEANSEFLEVRVTTDDAKKFIENNRSEIPDFVLKMDKDQQVFEVMQMLKAKGQGQAMSAKVAKAVEQGDISLGMEKPVEPRYDVSAGTVMNMGDRGPLVVAFIDYQCPYCREMVPVIEKIREEYGDRIRLSIRDFPLTKAHPLAVKAAVAARCASAQGEFKIMHDALFASQKQMKDQGEGFSFSEIMPEDKRPRFESCLNDRRKLLAVAEDFKEGKRLGLEGTPAYFIGGLRRTGSLSFDEMKALIDEAIENHPAEQQKQPEPQDRAWYSFSF